METSPEEYNQVAQRVLPQEDRPADTTGKNDNRRPRRRSYTSFFLLTALLAAILAGSFYLEKSAPVAVKCEDGTPFDECSATMPFYCMNGELVEKASLCGCPDDYSVGGSRCILVQRCEDGTIYGKCSSKKPFYCDNGTIVSKPSLCGCPDGYSVKKEECVRIRKCRDATAYGECSEMKPLYCREGVLVNDSGECGCPEGYASIGASCESPYAGSPDDRIMNYTLRGKSSVLKITVHEGLKEYLAALPRVYYCDPKCPTPQQLEMRYLADEKQKNELVKLVDNIKKISDEPADQARIAISLVQNIPYDTVSAEAGNLTNRYPYEVLFDQTGVCGEKSRLLAFILRELGYGVYLLDYEKEDHMAVALKCPIDYAQYSYNNTGYCFLETTRVSIMTDNTGEYSSDGSKLESVPVLLTVGEGVAFPADVEYRDAQDWIMLNERAASTGGTLDRDDYTRWKEIKEKYGIPTMRSGKNT